MGIQDIIDYQPQSVSESQMKEVILDLFSKEKNLFVRENQTAHFTTSTLIVSQDYQEVLLIHHKQFNTWTWTGGHNDGEEDFKMVALKEAQEETGIQEFSFLAPSIQSLDILPVDKHQKAGVNVPAHLHLNAAYILVANRSEQLVQNEEETNGVKWWPLKELLTVSSEQMMVPIYKKLLLKIEQISNV